MPLTVRDRALFPGVLLHLPPSVQAECLTSTASLLRGTAQQLVLLSRRPGTPEVDIVTDRLTALAEAHDHVVRETWSPPPSHDADADPAERLAHTRTTTALAWAGLLTARASLSAAPALVAAAQLQARPQPATPEELQTFRTSLSDSAAVLETAAQALLTVARHLDGPEPKVLRDLNSSPAGTKAASAARSRPRPPAVLSTGIRPTGTSTPAATRCTR
ncbi:hypothetical protein ACFC26_14870 [Kitasatospora purpeofusca]|uniref:hypothetical protein n=1 Tax=Kitasatospora purpeofusca TaxID=67352 RepID=UPI0035D796EE